MGRKETLTKNKGGRPKKEIDKTEFEKLCAIQCTKEEICAWFDLTDKTLERWCKEKYDVGFSEIFSIKRGLGKISLRRYQWQAAQKGNTAMLIWLGKQYLSQREPDSIIEEPKELPEFTGKTDAELDATIEKLNKKNGNGQDKIS